MDAIPTLSIKELDKAVDEEAIMALPNMTMILSNISDQHEKRGIAQRPDVLLYEILKTADKNKIAIDALSEGLYREVGKIVAKIESREDIDDEEIDKRVSEAELIRDITALAFLGVANKAECKTQMEALLRKEQQKYNQNRAQGGHGS